MQGHRGQQGQQHPRCGSGCYAPSLGEESAIFAPTRQRLNAACLLWWAVLIATSLSAPIYTASQRLGAVNCAGEKVTLLTPLLRSVAHIANRGGWVDIGALAGDAIALVGGYLAGIASGVVDKIKDSAIDRLHTLISTRLRLTKTGTAALEDLEEQPAEPGRQRLAAAALTEAAAEDRQFAADLESAVGAVKVSQVGGDAGTGGSQANVNVGGSMSMNRSFIANGNVDQSRRTFRISGGWVVVAGLVLAAAATTGVIVGTSGEKDPLSIGRDPGEAGARETAEAFVAALADHNARRACAFMSDEMLRSASDKGGCEALIEKEMFPRLPSTATLAEVSIDQVEVLPDKSTGTRQALQKVKAHLSKDLFTSGRGTRNVVSLVRELDRWVITG
jgi:hypothetical protein